MDQWRNRVHTIIPDYMFEKLIETGTAKERAHALRSLKYTAAERHQRVIRKMLPRVVSPSFSAGLDTHSARMTIKIFDADEKDHLPGKFLFDQDNPSTQDVAAKQAFDGLAKTWKFYWEVFKRNSIDDAGMTLIATIHYGEWDDEHQRYVPMGNAFWNGEQMVFGDGDDVIFGNFTSDVDVIAHELTHGVDTYTADLVYAFQSGALNEHFSDVFGILCLQYSLGQTATQADWLIGKNVVLGDEYALRSMKAPGTAYVNHPKLGTDPQPGHMKNYKELTRWQDAGGVHVNSGIPNRAFYLTATKIGGKAWEKPGLIWYQTLLHKLGQSGSPSFVQAAQATVTVARELYGTGSTEEKAVKEAWAEVGVL